MFPSVEILISVGKSINAVGKSVTSVCKSVTSVGKSSFCKYYTERNRFGHAFSYELLTPLRPKKSAIGPLVIAPTIAPKFIIDPNIEYYQEKHVENNVVSSSSSVCMAMACFIH